MIALFLSSLLLFFMYAVMGFATAKILALKALFVEKMLIGVAVLNTITAFISLAFPLNGYVLCFILLASVLFFLTVKSQMTIFAGKLIHKPRYLIIINILFLLPAIAMALNTSANNYDTALYHTQAIMWLEQYHAIPGLANLYGRFGFNPNVFCLSALSALTPLFNQHVYAVNFTIFVMMAAHFVPKLYTLFKVQGINAAFIFQAGLFTVILLNIHNLSSPSPDFLALTIPLFIVSRISGIVMAGKKLTFDNLLIIAVLATYVITVKLSALPVMLLPLILLLKHKVKTGQLILLLALPAIILLPWLVRNVITTGWLVYPFASLDLFNFDWQVPLIKVAGEHESVVGWARNPGPEYAASAHADLFIWLPLWLKQFSFYQKLLIVVGLLFPVICMGVQFVKKAWAGYLVNSIIIMALAGGIFWLFTAPVFRFGIAFIVIGMLSPLLLVKPVSYKTNLVVLFNLIIAALFCAQLFIVKGFIKNTVNHAFTLLIKPQHMSTPAETGFRVYKINGIDVYEPIDGDRCFEHQLPCTPYPDDKVVLRGNDISSGFKTLPAGN